MNDQDISLSTIVFDNINKEIVTVVGLSNQQFIWVKNLTETLEYRINKTDVSPVYLSVELMKRFGFKVSEFYGGIRFSKDSLNLINGVDRFSEITLVSEHSMGINEPTMPIRTAHDLQNLYLKIELKVLKFPNP